MKLNPQDRKAKSKEVREKAAQIAFDRNPDDQTPNNEESTFANKMMSFTKGLPHDPATGLIIEVNDFDKFVDGICSGDPVVIRQTPLGPKDGKWESQKGRDVDAIRGWESSGAGLTFDLEGPDAQVFAMRAAPALGSPELTAELAEVYCQAVLRDVPFSEFDTNEAVRKCVEAMQGLQYFSRGQRNNQPLEIANAFRGFAPGDLAGPYVSQFLLAGNNGLNNGRAPVPEFRASDGKINYGAITIDQRVRKAKEIDYMTTWEEYIDVQNAADFRGLEEYECDCRRFITSGRDLATYVHYDALYEAYLNACLILLGLNVSGGDKFDEGVPFQAPDIRDKQQGFAVYGGPHILTLVTEVATRALKAVRYQKFNIHRRPRPEVVAARMEKKDVVIKNLEDTWGPSNVNSAVTSINQTFSKLERAGIFDLLSHAGYDNKLLPMAFCEGSPMHPSYGAGHATVAGACVTILKAFFNHKLYLDVSADGAQLSLSGSTPSQGRAFVPDVQGQHLLVKELAQPLTLEGELNKLAANISIGRNWAGVHYYTDYTESLLLGEKIAIGLLAEQAITYNPAEDFYMMLPRFDGTLVRIDGNGVNPDPFV